MFKNLIKKTLHLFGLDIVEVMQKISAWSLKRSLSENGFNNLVARLRCIVPDVSDQEPGDKATFNDYWELKRRGMQAFQCALMLRALKDIPPGKIMVVDIGDSAGTHMLYLKDLTKDRLEIETLSVNLDPRAIEKIKTMGMKALLCRAEDLFLESNIDLFTSFEMVEHLHNPAIFLRRLAKKSTCNRLLITVPYMKNSRVGLYHIRNKSDKIYFAGDEHIFELCPEDWTLLFFHSGWKVVYSEIYYQYPRSYPILSQLLSSFWKHTDFEGFWGAIMEKNTEYSDFYQDWED
jgi:hypothetical protein